MTKPVGYASPPEHSKWQKGQSGNPRGRVKGQANLKSDLRAELTEMIQITEGGKSRQITKQRALVKSLTAKGIKGDGRAANLILNLMLRLIEPDTPTITDELAPDDAALLEAFVTQFNSNKGSSK